MTSQLDMLHALEEIRDALRPFTKDHPDGPGGAIRHAYRTAHYACEATYADLEAEAEDMNQAFEKATQTHD